MPKPRSPNRDKAYEIYQEHHGKIELNAIAAKLGIGDGTVRGWKNKDKWEERLFGTPPKKSTERSKRNTERSEPKKRGGQAGNTNAKGKGASKTGNQNAVKHGLFAKYIPDEAIEIMDAFNDAAPQDILWDMIQIKYAAIIRAQRIMLVTDKDEMIKELKEIQYEIRGTADIGYSSYVAKEEFDFQFAWDRQATFLNAQSRAMSELRSLIKQYIEISDPDEERKSKLELIQAKVAKERAEVNKLLEPNKTPAPTTIIVKRAGDS
ncbi:terminase [Listeria booriae]|uniref:phage terminase small subunit n=1 Tax=Listeria booriae TaxID=1552123 RepID=UPI001623F9F7|nr:phage terminase small subunit [Listeria booriae]MBC1209484.1 terminase [Listeria booriae]MBC1229797.1 terminase [Listeria booriae]MBC1233146.1 terminase [Listeria booriae]